MSVYKAFPKRELLKDWSKLLKCNREELVELNKEWEEIDKENRELNREMFEAKSKKLDEVTDFMKKSGIEVFKYKRKGFFTEKNGYQAWFKKNVVDVISSKYPSYSGSVPRAHMESQEIDGVKLYNNQSPTSIVELYDRINHQYKMGIEKLNKNNKLLIKSIEYANQNNIDIEDMSTEDIISVVDEFAKEKYLAEELPEGTEVYLKHECYDCSTYIMGERRCECGNRRIGITVEGNILEGFYYYPEAF